MAPRQGAWIKRETAAANLIEMNLLLLKIFSGLIYNQHEPCHHKKCKFLQRNKVDIKKNVAQLKAHPRSLFNPRKNASQSTDYRK